MSTTQDEEETQVYVYGKSFYNDNAPSKFTINGEIVARVCCGDTHSAFFTKTGILYTFGQNDWGQTGHGHKQRVTQPTKVDGLVGTIDMVSLGRSHTIVGSTAGILFSFGCNGNGQLGMGSLDMSESVVPMQVKIPPHHFKMLACGAEHSVALTMAGDLFVWGSGELGQLGNGRCVEGIATPEKLKTKLKITHVACGYYHTAFITEKDRSVYLFGENESGNILRM